MEQPYEAERPGEPLGNWEELQRLTKDLKQAAKTLKQREVRFLVDTYYMLQKNRVRSGNQMAALEKVAEPHALFNWTHKNAATLESNIKLALSYYSDGSPIGRWAESIMGIGPVISAGLLAHIDMAQAPTVGHIWRFAGLDPTVEWKTKEKRPWNASLKTLCWKIGESFVKVSARPKDYYGKVWLTRKALEQQRNEAGEFRDQATRVIATRDITVADQVKWYKGMVDPRVAKWWRDQSGKDVTSTPTVAVFREFLESNKAPKGMDEAFNKLRDYCSEQSIILDGIPMLSPGHIHSRAKRYAVKLFLSHWHWVAYEITNGTLPPKPFVIEHLGHVDLLKPPNWK